MSHLSRRDIDDLRPSIDRAVYKILGEKDSSLVSTAVHCLNSGYDKRKTIDKLSSYVDSKKALKLGDKIFDLVEDLRSSYSSKKRSRDDTTERESKKSKSSSSRYDERERGRERESRFDSDQSRYKERDNGDKKNGDQKKILDLTPKTNVNISNIAIPTPSIYGIPMGLLNRGEADKARKIAQLQAQIKNKLSSGILGSVIQIPVPSNKPTPLILDEEGRTVDKSGKAIQLTHVVPTLKANIRAQKREQFNKSQSHDKVQEDSGESRFIDSRLSVKPALRTKRALRFHEPGKFQQMAERLRMKVSMKKKVIESLTHVLN